MLSNQTPGKRMGGAAGAHAKKIAKTTKQKKRMPRFMVAVWCFVFFLLLLAGAGYCMYANVGGVAEKALVLLPQYKASLDDLEKQRADLAARELKLKQDRENLASGQKSLVKKETELMGREEKLNADQADFEAKRGEAKTEQEQRQVTIDIYTALEPGKAAAMLDKATTLQEAAAILKLLAPETITAILSEMDPKKALELTKLIRQ